MTLPTCLPTRYRPSLLPLIAGYCLILTFLLASYLLFRSPNGAGVFFPHKLQPAIENYLELVANVSTFGPHPIDDLIADAQRAHDALLLQRSTNLNAASRRYRERRHRHPPPGFDKWVEYALKHDAVIVEQFFDRIEHDIRPFWAQDPKLTATWAAAWHHVVRVRNGNVSSVGDVQNLVPWLKHWKELVAEAAKFMPDVDMPINYMDESRILVPWEDINLLVQKAEKERKITPIEDTVREYTGLAEIDMPQLKVYDPNWITTGSYWDLVRLACSPNSPGRNVSAPDDYSNPPNFPQNWRPSFSESGYVKNFTAGTDPCIQPHIRTMHGTFVEPVSLSTSQELIPLFGGSKLPVNNEILIPGAMYLTDDPLYSGGSSHGPPWTRKKGGIIWRGVASGGRNKEENWTHFQRHRLVEMLNGTTVSSVERNGIKAKTFEMPPIQMYNFTRRRKGLIGEWLRNISDAGFMDLVCFPPESNCSYVAPYFRKLNKIPMKKQYEQKFMPDVDGNSFSGRFRGLLLSTSLPIKSTIYIEWHNDRLIPWVHFAPMDNTFQDLYAILDYFTRDKRGDAAARVIAETGKNWAEKVLRRDDMLLYVWRLLLEFARVCDKNRDKLGFIDDLVPG